MNLVQAAFHARFKRRATQRFVVSLTISVEARANGTNDLLNNHEGVLRQIWEENKKWVVSHVLGMIQVKLDFQVDYWDFVNYTKAVCTDNYVLSGSRCRTCSVGNYFNHTSNECQYCPVGEYKDKNGLSTCTTCPKETSTKSTGSDSIYACKAFCRPGSSSTDGLEICVICKKGYYQDEYGQTKCKQCPEGKTTILANSSSINDCKVPVTNNTCITSSCNGHRCLNIDGNLKCACSDGWSGKSCEETPDACVDNICMNRATCITKNDSYACKCPTKYTGALCQNKPWNGGWSEWSGWSDCSASCDEGFRQRTRLCNNPSPSEYGDNCLGITSQRKICIMDECQVCSNLDERNHSSLDCTKNRYTGIQTCSVRCNDGFILTSAFDELQELRCGMPTGFHWLPTNITAPCAEIAYPRSLKLQSNIEYTEPIPFRYYETVRQHLREKLLPTGCFKSTTCKLEIALSPETTEEVVERTILKLSLERRIKSDENATGQVLAPLLAAIKDMENTALYLKNMTSEVFDVYLSDTARGTVKRSPLAFISNKSSFTMEGKVECEQGHVATGGVCIKCPPGTYAANQSCHLCIRGTFQHDAGQITCSLCPPGLTTKTVGSFSKLHCEEDITIVKVGEDSQDSTLTVVGTYVGITTGILGVILSFLSVYKCKKSRQDKYKVPAVKDKKGQEVNESPDSSISESITEMYTVEENRRQESTRRKFPLYHLHQYR